MTAPDLLEELERLSAAATPGEWWVGDPLSPEDGAAEAVLVDYGNNTEVALTTPGVGDYGNGTEPERWHADAALAAASVNYVRALLAASGTGERPTISDAAPRFTLDREGVLYDRGVPLTEVPAFEPDTITALAEVLHRLPFLPAAPTPPDAGTGTPSDDERAVPFTTVDAFGNVYVVAHGNVAIDAPTPVTLWPASLWPPAAPSGTTGATTGGES